MKTFSHLLAASVCAAAIPSAFAAPMFYNTTHADESYKQWQVSTNAPPGADGNYGDFLTSGPWVTAQACTNIFYPFGPAPATRLDWISNTTTCSSSVGGSIGGTEWTQFIFRQSFELTAAEAATLQLTFNWAADDSGQEILTRGKWTPKWSLNSLLEKDLVPTFWPGSPSPGDSYSLSPTVTVSGFQAGTNTLYFWVQGNGITDGMRLANAQFSNKVPEPTSFALVGLALVGAGLARRRASAVR
ncbi:MAG: PEP-CTERM sorting domain-containing protein [Betaproteobacteria bacterium]|jgi:hypothetical protein